MQRMRNYGNFRGKIFGVENALKEMKESGGKNYKGKNVFINDTMIKLQLRLKTCEENMVYIELLQFKKPMSGDVMLFSTDKEKKDSKTVAWKDRYAHKDSGFETFGVKVKVSPEGDIANLFPIDAIKAILEGFKDGDSVFVGTEMSHQIYKDKQQNPFGIQRIFKSKDEIDFGAEDFTEVSDFQSKLAFKGIFDLDDGLLVNGIYVDYKGDMVDVSYVVEDPDVAEYFKSNVSFGDGLEVEGVVHNRVTYKESTTVDDSSGTVVGKRPSSFNNNRTREIESEKRHLEILTITSHTQGMYLEDLNGSTAQGDEPLPWEM